MLRCSRLTRRTLLHATLVRLAAMPPKGAAEPSTTASSGIAECDSGTQPRGAGSLQHAKEESDTPSPYLAEDAVPLLQLQRQPKFLFKGRRGSSSPEYYMTRSNAGHPDAVAELLGAGRDDPEWMWLKLLCFVCTMATIGTTLYGYFFAEHVKYFMDEPWSRFTY
ncbi:hypothetical protein ABL78_0377 [Leptomonas seymouri]|uniref:Uncharacterized protein n=1 Tax=Leptomonas seymouri TaxID=5684 RepID=A0A0N0P996_LEPSE|nr:hypothetical protein ABL78_0377 [Leptomonas seymouri]|eukprot:KPI90447.1 hypothetical protein ABL78_0377 [Leptomonas seymouri]